MPDQVVKDLHVQELRVGKIGTPTGDASSAIELEDDTRIRPGSVVGLRIATNTVQKVGFHGANPSAQDDTSVTESAFVENAGGTAINVDSTADGYTFQQIVKALRNKGIIA